MACPKHLLSLTVLTVALVTGAAPAQEIDTAVDAPDKTTINFRLTPGFEYVWGTGIHGGGDFNTLRMSVAFSATSALTDDLDLTLGLEYEYNNYEFSGETTFGGPEPWDNAHIFDLGAIFTYRPANDWAFFAGPVMQFAGEADADFGESWIAGGVVGASYRFADDLLLGAGVGIVSQLEEEVRFFPIAIIEWDITDDLRVSSRTAGNAGGRSGLELIYDIAENWELAAGLGYEFRRFRLDDDGPVPEGVGEDTGLPIWGRLSYQMTEKVKLNLYGGALANGEFKIRDAAGVDIGHRDYETAVMVGFSAVIRF